MRRFCPIGTLLVALALGLGALGCTRPPAGGPTPAQLATAAQTCHQAGGLAAAGETTRAVRSLREQIGELEGRPGAEAALAECLLQLGALHGRGDELATARSELQRAVGLLEGVRGPDAPALAEPLTRLADVLFAQGQFAAARALEERALALREASLGPDDPQLADSLRALARLQLRLHDLDGARRRLERALALLEGARGAQHPDTLRVLGDLAEIRLLSGDAAGARSLAEAAVDLLAAALGADHPAVATRRVLLARVLTELGEYKRAAAQLEAADSALEGIGGGHSLAAAAQREAAARLAARRGRPAEALALGRRALELREALQGTWHIDTARAVLNLGLLLRGAGDTDAARDQIAKATALGEQALDPLLQATSDRERLSALYAQRTFFDAFLSVFDRPEDGAAVYTVVMRFKGAVGRTLAWTHASSLASRDPETARLLRQLTVARQRLAELVLNPAEAPRALNPGSRFAELIDRRDELERALAARCEALGSAPAPEPGNPQRLCAALAPDEALVDFVRYHRLPPGALSADDPGIEEHWVAFVLPGGDCATPRRIELGPRRRLVSAARHYRRLLEGGATVERLQRAGRRLASLFAYPLAEAIGERPHLLLVPAGELNAVPADALPDHTGRLLIERFTVRYLASAGDWLSTAQAGDSRGALVVGGVDYGPPPPGAPLSVASLRGTGFSSLPATRVEAQRVAQTLNQAAGAPVTLLTGREADEARVKAAARGKRVLHLATHGFLASSESGAADLGLASALSGVLLAGANERVPGTAGGDGRLTAEEVASLDLRGTELVVLSACETGLGELTWGEGVLGLRRAFAMAGARALVFSLWKVPDEETRALMEDFHARRSGGQDGAEALRSAKLALIEKLRRERGEADPRLWAAFVYSGR